MLHNQGKGSKYVKSRGGGTIIYSERFRTLSRALKREAEVKNYNREEKISLTTTKNPSQKFAVIFDMDGVMIKNDRFHYLAYKKLGYKVTFKEYLENMSGRRAVDNFEYVLKRKLGKDEAKKLAEKKGVLYRRLYRPHIKLISGLAQFFKQLKEAGIKVVLATSGSEKNVRLVLRVLKLKNYFFGILSSSHVKAGKPHPEIYLKAARLARMPALRCVVFEDALNGILAAKRAKMKVVGVTTSLSKKQLSHTDLIIKDFHGLTIKKLSGLFG